VTDISIVDYDDEMKTQVKDLFCTIYPEQPDIADRMCYDKDLPEHIATKVAFDAELLVGQANIFLKKTLDEIANLGFHVHPDWRRRGLAKAMSIKAIKDAKAKGISDLYIRTQEENIAAIAVAKSLSFIRDDSGFSAERIIVFRKAL
jgi:RimJ/RimL family protein N-acetyltransferase